MHFKRHKPNPKHDTYGSWTVESKTHQAARQPQVHDSTVVNRVKRYVGPRNVKHREPEDA